MAAKRTRIRKSRRDRRLAKASGWRREPTGNPKKVGHHLSFSIGGPLKGLIRKRAVAKYTGTKREKRAQRRLAKRLRRLGIRAEDAAEYKE